MKILLPKLRPWFASAGFLLTSYLFLHFRSMLLASQFDVSMDGIYYLGRIQYALKLESILGAAKFLSAQASGSLGVGLLFAGPIYLFGSTGVILTNVIAVLCSLYALERLFFKGFPNSIIRLAQLSIILNPLVYSLLPLPNKELICLSLLLTFFAHNSLIFRILLSALLFSLRDLLGILTAVFAMIHLVPFARRLRHNWLVYLLPFIGSGILVELSSVSERVSRLFRELSIQKDNSFLTSLAFDSLDSPIKAMFVHFLRTLANCFGGFWQTSYIFSAEKVVSIHGSSTLISGVIVFFSSSLIVFAQLIRIKELFRRVRPSQTCLIRSFVLLGFALVSLIPWVHPRYLFPLYPLAILGSADLSPFSQKYAIFFSFTLTLGAIILVLAIRVN